MQKWELPQSNEETELDGILGDARLAALGGLQNKVRTHEAHEQAVRHAAEAAAIGAVCLTAGIIAGRRVFRPNREIPKAA